jgi:hypothetical protein
VTIQPTDSSSRIQGEDWVGVTEGKDSFPFTDASTQAQGGTVILASCFFTGALAIPSALGWVPFVGPACPPVLGAWCSNSE